MNELEHRIFDKGGLYIIAVIIIMVCLMIGLQLWHHYRGNVALENTYTMEIPAGIKAKINEMGPLYDYKISPDGDLKVNKGDGVWLRLEWRGK